MIARVAVYCGSKTGDSPVFVAAAAAFGRALAAHQLDLVYGGAHHGLMGAVASGVLEGGRHVIGVVPRGLARQEFAHPELSEHVVEFHPAGAEGIENVAWFTVEDALGVLAHPSLRMCIGRLLDALADRAIELGLDVPDEALRFRETG